MTPPDSDAAKFDCYCGTAFAGTVWAHDKDSCKLTGGTVVEPDLAQRILAALEEHRGCVACPVLARELRAVIGK